MKEGRFFLPGSFLSHFPPPSYKIFPYLVMNTMESQNQKSPTVTESLHLISLNL